MSEQKHGYANYKRAELLKILKPFLGKLKNISTGIEANLSKKSLEKMTSAKSLEKSKAQFLKKNETTYVVPYRIRKEHLEAEYLTLEK